MRDRMMKLLCGVECDGEETLGNCPQRRDGKCRTIQKLEMCQIGAIADHLLANGVIVPPCKVGVEVYFAVKERDRIFKGELISFSLDAAHFWFFCRYYCGLNFWHQVEDFGKTVFLTGEEAEQALKGGDAGARNS